MDLVKMKSAEMWQISLFLFPCIFISPSDDTSLSPSLQTFPRTGPMLMHTFFFFFPLFIFFLAIYFSFLSFPFSLGEWSFRIKSIFKSFQNPFLILNFLVRLKKILQQLLSQLLSFRTWKNQPNYMEIYAIDQSVEGYKEE